jgi:hypothetical protein
MYEYDYDDRYQLTGANFGIPDFTAGATSPITYLGNQYKLDNLHYDANGNIRNLRRYDGEALNGSVPFLHDFYVDAINDGYQYLQNKKPARQHFGLRRIPLQTASASWRPNMAAKKPAGCSMT